MAKILTDALIPELKSKVLRSAFQPGDQYYISETFIGTGFNSKRKVVFSIPINADLSQITSVKFVSGSPYGVQWDSFDGEIHIPTITTSTTITTIPTENFQINKVIGLKVNVEFTSDISSTSNYQRGLVSMDGALQFF